MASNLPSIYNYTFSKDLQQHYNFREEPQADDQEEIETDPYILHIIALNIHINNLANHVSNLFAQLERLMSNGRMKEEDAKMAEEKRVFSALEYDYNYLGGEELIPGFSCEEFRASLYVNSAEDLSGSSSIQNPPPVSKEFLALFRKLPVEVRHHIFRCTVSFYAKFIGNGAPPTEKNPHLIRNYTPISDDHRRIGGISADSGFAPVKYSLHLSSPLIRKHQQAVLLSKINFKFRTKKLPPNPTTGGSATIQSQSLPTIISVVGDVYKDYRGNLQTLDNDYQSVREYDEMILFLKGLLHSEGYTYAEGYRRLATEEGASLVGEFLTWFWKNFVLEFTCETKACYKWLSENYNAHDSIEQVLHSPFRHIQNINIDVLGSPYIPRTGELKGENFTIPKFAAFCDRLAFHPNLQNLSVYLWIQDTDIEGVIGNPGAYTWIRSIRNVPVKNKFTLLLKPFGAARHDEPKNVDEIKECKKEGSKIFSVPSPEETKMYAEYQKRLELLLMPDSLGDGE